MLSDLLKFVQDPVAVGGTDAPSFTIAFGFRADMRSLSSQPIPAAVSGPEYYTVAFQYLERLLSKELEQALLLSPRQQRAAIILRLVQAHTVLDGPATWPIIKTALDDIEHQIAKLIGGHSVAFWMHLYRRIAPMLHPEHEDKTDPRTAALVRKIVEAAICKYGIADRAEEFCLSSDVNIKKILGGVLISAIKETAPKPHAALREMERHLAATPQWVIKQFASADFVTAYQIEGLAYQYWRIMALLRSLGKGASVEFSADGEWIYRTTPEFDFLIRSIDERTDKIGLDYSLIGVWFDQRQKFGRGSPVLLAPTYNVRREEISGWFKDFGFDFRTKIIPNFLPAPLNVNEYLNTHRDFSSALRKKHGFSLDAIVHTMWAVNQLVLIPFAALVGADEDTIKQLLFQTAINLCQRGYRIISVERDTTIVMRVIRTWTEFPSTITDDELRRAIDFLKLSPNVQNSISLWTGGPRDLLIAFNDEHTLIDQEPVASILQTLFFGVQYNQTSRGTLFEVEFREALERSGFSVKHGVLEPREGNPRELDAAVIVQRKLIIMECVSVERPLDYEIGNPNTFSVRQARLEEKIAQVLSLAEFIRAEPRGRNYAFEDFDEIEAFVVSPFFEWIWERSDRLWVGERPRVLAAAEALEFLKSLTAGAS